MKKTITNCCALCQISVVNNMTPLEDLKQQIKKLTNESQETSIINENNKGQTSVFVITSPGEEILEDNLYSLGFKVKHTFNRRKGYPKGELKMFIKNL